MCAHIASYFAFCASINVLFQLFFLNNEAIICDEEFDDEFEMQGRI